MNKKYISLCLLAVFVCLVFTLVVAGITKPESPEENLSKTSDEQVNFEVQEGEYSVKITAVYDTVPDTDEENPPKADRVAVVVYEYTNEDISNGLAISNTHFKAYNIKGKELKLYPQKGLFVPVEVGESDTFTASVAFALNSDENYIKIEYYNDVSSKKADAIYEKTW